MVRLWSASVPADAQGLIRFKLNLKRRGQVGEVDRVWMIRGSFVFAVFKRDRRMVEQSWS